MSEGARLAAVVLAGGSSTRMGRPKALLEIGGETFLARIVRVAREAGLGPVRIVVGEHAQQIELAESELTPLLLHNSSPEDGQLSSLQIALGALEGDPEPGVVVFLVDHPLVRRDTVEALVRAFRRSSADVVVPVMGGRRGHPVVFGRSFYPALRQTPLELGARGAIERHAKAVEEVHVDDPGILVDVDTPADLEALRGEGV